MMLSSDHHHTALNSPGGGGGGDGADSHCEEESVSYFQELHHSCQIVLLFRVMLNAFNLICFFNTNTCCSVGFTVLSLARFCS